MSNIDPQTAKEVQSILTRMVAELLLHKPEEPIPFIIQHIHNVKNTGVPALTKDEKSELN
jgi:uncharacterized iron-regulated protein